MNVFAFNVRHAKDDFPAHLSRFLISNTFGHRHVRLVVHSRKMKNYSSSPRTGKQASERRRRSLGANKFYHFEVFLLCVLACLLCLHKSFARKTASFVSKHTENRAFIIQLFMILEEIFPLGSSGKVFSFALNFILLELLPRLLGRGKTEASGKGRAEVEQQTTRLSCFLKRFSPDQQSSL
jgi:hypothetical protein